MGSLTRRDVLLGVGAAALVAACERGGDPSRDSETQVSGVRRFPDSFVWGAATSAYQIEGATTADGRGASIWDTFSETPGNVWRNATGDPAADHYHRWADDVDLMDSLGLGGYRFSIAWPRIMPDGTGQVNQRGLDFYRRLVDRLVGRRIAPTATLFHWDLPQVLQDKGGFANRDCAYWFADYAAAVFDALGDVIPTWITINEPKTFAMVGHLYGTHAPGIRDEPTAYLVLHHLLLAHGLAVQALRDRGSEGRIGPALNLMPTYPADDSDRARGAAVWQDIIENRSYLDPILRGEYPDGFLEWLQVRGAGSMAAAIKDGDMRTISLPIDLLGVQYYHPVIVDGDGDRVYRHARTQAEWQEVYPDGLYDMLTRLARDYGDIPLVITENGLPTQHERDRSGRVDDQERIAFLHDHLAAAHRAIQGGVRLEGYHLWSLLDNFEWAQGYSQRWGIVYVDFETQERIPKASAEWYRGVATTNELT